MIGYQLDKKPWLVDRETGISVFQGVSEESKQPVTARRFDCSRADTAATVLEMNRRLGEGMAQSKVDYQHAAKLLDLRVDITADSHSVVHVMEPLAKNVGADLEERKRFSRRYTEAELRTFLWHSARALAFAHSKVSATQQIPHGDFKPASVFLCGDGTHKVADFGSSAKLQPKSSRLPCLQAQDAFKTDVFALAASALQLATFSKPAALTAANLDAAVDTEVASLALSESLRSLLRDMLRASEDLRVSIADVVDRITAESVQVQLAPRTGPKIRLLSPSDDEGQQRSARSADQSGARTVSASPLRTPNPQLASLSKKHVRLFNFETRTWGPPSSLEMSIECHKDSVYALVEADKLFCCGGFGTLHTGSGNTAYIVTIGAEHSRVQVLPEMNEGRGLPGIVAYKGAMYVFAARNSTASARYRYADLSKTGEMIDLETASMWLRLEGAMEQGRCSFGACVFRHRVFLSPGCGARTVELYDLLKGRFCEGPDLLLPQAEAYAVWMQAGQMTLISRNSVSKIDCREAAPRALTQAHPDMKVSPNTNPAVSGHCVFWVQGDMFVKATMNRTVILLEESPI